MSSDETSAAPPPPRPIKVWDLPVRLTHVAFIALVGASWYTGETMHVYTFGQQGLSQFDWHRYSGYAVLALVLFRILWGFFGSETARFSNFIRGPGTVKDYLRRLFRPSYRASLGHNPLGGWSVVLILALLLAQTVTGLMSYDDTFGLEGPLYPLVGEDAALQIAGIHQLLFNILLAVLAVHIIASLGYFLLKKENLVLPMITGVKTHEAPGQPVMVPAWRALVLLGLSALMVWGLVSGLG